MFMTKVLTVILTKCILPFVSAMTHTMISFTSI